VVFGGAPTWVYYAWPIGDAAIALPAVAWWIRREGVRGSAAWLTSVVIWLWGILPFAAGYLIFSANPGQ
jgi:hypothetical protein